MSKANRDAKRDIQHRTASKTAQANPQAVQDAARAAAEVDVIGLKEYLASMDYSEDEIREYVVNYYSEIGRLVSEKI